MAAADAPAGEEVRPMDEVVLRDDDDEEVDEVEGDHAVRGG